MLEYIKTQVGPLQDGVKNGPICCWAEIQAEAQGSAATNTSPAAASRLLRLYTPLSHVLSLSLMILALCLWPHLLCHLSTDLIKKCVSYLIAKKSDKFSTESIAVIKGNE